MSSGSASRGATNEGSSQSAHTCPPPPPPPPVGDEAQVDEQRGTVTNVKFMQGCSPATNSTVLMPPFGVLGWDTDVLAKDWPELMKHIPVR